MNLRLAAIFVLALGLSASADTLFLKGGQRLEGDVTDKGGSYEVRSEAGTILIPKGEVAKIVKGLEAIKTEAEAIHAKARALYEEGVKLEDPKAANEKLKAGAELLRKVIDLYHDARETYFDDKYAAIDQTLVTLFQEMRLFRDKMSSEIAPAPVDKPVAKPEEKPEPKPATPTAKPAVVAPKEPVIAKVDLPALQAKAAAGDPESQYQLGLYFDIRDWGAVDAIKSYRALAEKGHPKAQWRMGVLAIQGRGGRQDYKKAYEWLQKAEAKGLALAQFQIGKLYFDGKAFPKNLKKANEYCDRAEKKIIQEANAGDPEALVALGWMYLEGMGVAQIADYALQCYQKACDLGYLPAYWELGFIYQNGSGLPKNRDEAIRCLTVAADQGMARAQVALGELYSPSSDSGLPSNYGKALELWKKAQAQGHPGALYRIGQYCMWGDRALPQDQPQAIKLWNEALKTATGQLQMQLINDLGYAHSHGQGGLPVDKREALKYYRMAADLGLTMAIHNVGALTDSELKNPGEAMKWFTAASKLGWAHSSRLLGDHYLRGDGVKKNFDEAERWYLVAVQQGDKLAADSINKVKVERNLQKK